MSTVEKSYNHSRLVEQTENSRNSPSGNIGPPAPLNCKLELCGLNLEARAIVCSLLLVGEGDINLSKEKRMFLLGAASL